MRTVTIHFVQMKKLNSLLKVPQSRKWPCRGLNPDCLALEPGSQPLLHLCPSHLPQDLAQVTSPCRHPPSLPRAQGGRVGGPQCIQSGPWVPSLEGAATGPVNWAFYLVHVLDTAQHHH